MTELSFLIELLMNHKLPKATKELVAARIKEVEGQIHAQPIRAPAAVNRMGQQPPAMPAIPQAPAIPVEAIAQTPEAAAAIASRNAALREGLSPPMKGQERPRKW